MHQETKQVFVCDQCLGSDPQPAVYEYGKLVYFCSTGSSYFDEFRSTMKIHPYADKEGDTITTIGVGKDDKARRADCVERFTAYCREQQRIYSEALGTFRWFEER